MFTVWIFKKKKKNLLQKTEDNIHKTFIGMNFKEIEREQYHLFFVLLNLLYKIYINTNYTPTAIPGGSHWREISSQITLWSFVFGDILKNSYICTDGHDQPLIGSGLVNFFLKVNPRITDPTKSQKGVQVYKKVEQIQQTLQTWKL